MHISRIAVSFILARFLHDSPFQVARLLRRHIRPLVIPSKDAEQSVSAYVYHFCSLLLTMVSLNYLATPFLLLSGMQTFLSGLQGRVLCDTLVGSACCARTILLSMDGDVRVFWGAAGPSLQYWRHWGFLPHGMAFALYIATPVLFPLRQAHATTKKD